MREGGERKRKEVRSQGDECALMKEGRERSMCNTLRTELEIDKSIEDIFVKKNGFLWKWTTSIGFGVELILGFLMEVEVEVEATFHHTKDTKW